MLAQKAEMTALHQVNDEVLNNLSDSSQRSTQDQNQWLPNGYLRLIERYLSKELHILVQFRIRGIAEDYIACFQREGAVRNTDPITAHHIGEPIIACGRGTGERLTRVHGSDFSIGCKEKPVLVNVVKAMQAPKDIIPSLVWFDRADRVYRGLVHAIYLSSVSGLVFRGIVKDGERGLCGKFPFVVSPNKRVSEVIKGAPEVLQDLPGQQIDERRDILNRNCVIDRLSGLRIALYSEAIGVLRPEVFDSFAEITEVIVGPLDF